MSVCIVICQKSIKQYYLTTCSSDDYRTQNRKLKCGKEAEESQYHGSGKIRPVAGGGMKATSPEAASLPCPLLRQRKRIRVYEHSTGLSIASLSDALSPPQSGADGSGPGLEGVHGNPQSRTPGAYLLACPQRTTPPHQGALRLA
jgi:hypothetical protein